MTGDAAHRAYQVVHDLRAPLIVIQSFVKELEYAAQGIVDLVGAQGGDIPEQLNASLGELINQDLLPCLRHIGTASQQFDGLIDNLSDALGVEDIQGRTQPNYAAPHTSNR